MLRCFLALALFILLSLNSSTLSAANQASYDEYSDSPTIHLEGCGVYPAMRVMIKNQEALNRAFIRNGRVYLVARETLEGLGGKVIWVGKSKVFYAQYPKSKRTIRVQLGSPAVRLYQYNPKNKMGIGREIKVIKLNASPIMCDGEIFVPMRTAVEAAGGIVQYDKKKNAVYISPPPQKAAKHKQGVKR